MNMMKVNLDGRRYRLFSDENAEYMQEVADYVSAQMNTLRGEDQRKSCVDVATLAALNIADTLFSERAKEEDLRRQLKDALDEIRELEKQMRAAGVKPKKTAVRPAAKKAAAPAAPAEPEAPAAAETAPAAPETPVDTDEPLAGEYVPAQKPKQTRTRSSSRKSTRTSKTAAKKK